jgi:hypothetical protein
VHQLAAYHQLGAPTAAYRRRFGPWWIGSIAYFVLAAFHFLYVAATIEAGGAPRGMMLEDLILGFAFAGGALIVKRETQEVVGARFATNHISLQNEEQFHGKEPTFRNNQDSHAAWLRRRCRMRREEAG